MKIAYSVHIARREAEYLRGRLLSYGITYEQMHDSGIPSGVDIADWIDAPRTKPEALFALLALVKAYRSIVGDLRLLRSSMRSQIRESTLKRAVNRAKIRANITWSEIVRRKNGPTAMISVAKYPRCVKNESYASIHIGPMWKRRIYSEGIAHADSIDGKVFVMSATPKSSAYMKANGIDCWEALVVDGSKSNPEEHGFVFRTIAADGSYAAVYHKNFRRGSEVAMKRMSETIIELME